MGWHKTFMTLNVLLQTKNSILTLMIEKITILLLFFISSELVIAQSQHNNELYNNGALIHIQSGAEVHVLGDVHMRSATGILQNNGLLKIDGDLYGDNLFQQRGTGTTRIQNNLVNIGENQKISGSFAVRGGQAEIGVNDGSFYNLELSNGTGIVWLEPNIIASSTPYVADVRNSVDFNGPGSPTMNRIITTSPGSIPANGSDYSAIFGIMNAASGFTPLVDNTIVLNGNSSSVDAGYIQGKLRRAISSVGGVYNFPVGLEPAGSTAKRGVQYMSMVFSANNYDVVESYFQTVLPNTMPLQMECSGYSIDYWGGADHGQWIVSNPSSGTGNYSVNVWPQDHTFPTKTVWVVTKDNSIQGTANECGSTYIGLQRTGFSGFSNSSFGVAAAENLALPSELINIWSESMENYIKVNWLVGSEHNVSHYNLERSIDGNNFELIATINAAGNSQDQLNYSYDDYNVLRNQLYYYRYRVFDYDGTAEYSPIVQGLLNETSNLFSSEAISIYPNPSTDQMNINIASNKERFINVSVYNAIGQLVLDKNSNIQPGNSILPINAYDWATGMYQVKITDTVSKELTWLKFIKK